MYASTKLPPVVNGKQLSTKVRAEFQGQKPDREYRHAQQEKNMKRLK